MATIDLPLSHWNMIRSSYPNTVYKDANPWGSYQSPTTEIGMGLVDLTNLPISGITKTEFFWKVISHDATYGHFFTTYDTGFNPDTSTWNNLSIGNLVFQTTFSADNDGSLEITTGGAQPTLLIQNETTPTNTTFDPSGCFIRVTYIISTTNYLKDYRGRGRG